MRTTVLLSTLFVLVLASGAFAHHPFAAEFDRDKPVTLTGTVTSFEWANPHAAIHLDGQDARGNKGEWVVELGGINELTRDGWTKGSVKNGDKVSIEGWMAKDGTRHANAKEVRIAGGPALMAASSFNAPDGGQIASANTQSTTGTSGRLPGTASPLPLAGLLGLLSFAGALGLRALRH